MRKDIKTRAGIFPMPVLMVASYNEDGTVNVMNAAWGTMISRELVALNLSEGHKTTENIKKRKAFTISFADLEHRVEADYFGLVSGKDDPEKFAKSGLSAKKSKHVDAPIINEFPLCLECEFIEGQFGDRGVGVIGKIVNTSADAGILKDGQVCIEKLNAIAFDPYTRGYYRIADRVGEAYKDGEKLK